MYIIFNIYNGLNHCFPVLVHLNKIFVNLWLSAESSSTFKNNEILRRMGYLLEIRFCLRSSISHESLLPIEFRCQTHSHFLETARKGIDVESVQDARFTILRANRDSFLLSLRLSRHDMSMNCLHCAFLRNTLGITVSQWNMGQTGQSYAM